MTPAADGTCRRRPRAGTQKRSRMTPLTTLFLLPVTTDDLFLLLRTLALLALLLAFLRWYEPRMVFYPNYPTRRIERTPEEVGLAYEEVELATEDGTRITGWFLAAGCRIEQPPPPYSLLFFHGNAGNVSHCLDKCRVFLDLGLDVLLIDYRGYGRSDGRPSENGTYQDARAAYDYLTGPCGVDACRVLLYGESLGTGIAVDLATRVPVGGVVLEAAFTSLADVGQRIFWFLPVRRLIRNRYDSLRKIANVNAPLLLLHSRDDEYFSIRHARRLLGAARTPARLVELRGKHASAFHDSEAVCREALQQFIAGLPDASVRQPDAGQG